MHIINYTDQIHKILSDPTLALARDSDYFLTWQLARKLIRDVDKMSVFDFLQAMDKEEFPQFETIRRTRQKLQEQHPALRGKEYENRHRFGKAVRKAIRNVVT